MNKGLRYATGDYINFIGSDDAIYRDDTIEKIIAYFNDNVDVLAGNVMMVREKDLFEFVQDNKQLLISGGLGEHTIPFRIFNPKELLYIEISQEVSHGDSR